MSTLAIMALLLSTCATSRGSHSHQPVLVLLMGTESIPVPLSALVLLGHLREDTTRLLPQTKPEDKRLRAWPAGHLLPTVTDHREPRCRPDTRRP